MGRQALAATMGLKDGKLVEACRALAISQGNTILRILRSLWDEEKYGLEHVTTTSEKFDMRDVLPFGDLGPFLEQFSDDEQGVLLERLVFSINWLYGFRQPVARLLTQHQWRFLERLSVQLSSFWGIYGGAICEPVDWTSELRKKFVGYDGAEVHTAEEFTWEQLLPALPPKHLTGN
eukprot:6460971-Amphidinium_carterae.1